MSERVEDITEQPDEQAGRPPKPIIIIGPSDVPGAVRLAQRRRRSRYAPPPETIDAFAPLPGEEEVR